MSPDCLMLDRISSMQVLRGGQEAPTKPKGRPKKNSIPTTEEVEAEEEARSAQEQQPCLT